MATIRFEGVSITAKVIQLEGVSNPIALLEALGLEGATVHDGDFENGKNPGFENEVKVSKEEKESPEPIPEMPEEQTNLSFDPAPPVKKEAPSRVEIPKLDVSEFDDAVRLSDVVQVFMDAGITSVDEIIQESLRLKDKVNILKRVTNIEERMPLAIDKWRERLAE